MAFLKSIDSLMEIDWSRSYLWDAKFMPAPAGFTQYEMPPHPFDDWFPATDYDETARTSQSLMLSFHNSLFKVPQGAADMSINLTYMDDINFSLSNWVKRWYDEIYSITEGTAMLSEIVRLLIVAKLNFKHEIIQSTKFLVYPEASLLIQGSSDSDSKSQILNLVVAGTMED